MPVSGGQRRERYMTFLRQGGRLRDTHRDIRQACQNWTHLRGLVHQGTRAPGLRSAIEARKTSKAVAFRVETQRQFRTSGGRVNRATAVKAQQNQPPAPRATARLLSRNPLSNMNQTLTDKYSQPTKASIEAQETSNPIATGRFSRLQSPCIVPAAYLQPDCTDGTGGAMKDGPQARILEAVERIPDWLRRDLALREEATRQRANETLAGMIASALTEHARR